MADARPVLIEGPAGSLEAAVREAQDPRGAIVLAHPHPLYGGTLHNPVIFHADRELNRAGFTTLRFNFRGVGKSEGAYDEGRGEVADVGAAVAWMRALVTGLPLILVGYSFGSRCAVEYAMTDRAIDGVVAIGLPVRMFRFDDLPELGRPLAVVQGTQDEYGSIDEVASLIATAVPPGRLYVVPGATHLFPGKAPRAGVVVAEAVLGIVQGLEAPTS